jgi:uncharacterized protein (DUF362 family)
MTGGHGKPMSRVAKVPFTTYRESICRALDLIEAPEILPKSGRIIIKPNLTNSSPPPVTTSVDAVYAVCQYCTSHTDAEILVGEGAGSGSTQDVFEGLGYGRLSHELGIRLVDFNSAKTVELKRADAFHLKSFHLPEIAQNAFVISVPVLKDHCFTTTTVAMKNMFGIAPAPFYGGSWNKSKLHSPSCHRSIVDVCLYKSPSLSVIDASTALSGSHLSGVSKKLGYILASFDPVAADAAGSRLLGHDPMRIEYLKLSSGRLGDMNNITYCSAAYV